MKVRNGFVSNSSSSSFVIGIAAITKAKYESLPEELKKVCINPVELIGGEVSGWDYPSFCIKPNGTTYFSTSVDFGCGGSVEVALRNDQLFDHMLVFLDARGEEPTWDEDNGYNYDDVDLTEDWFSKGDLNTAWFIQDSGGQTSYGGGHDG